MLRKNKTKTNTQKNEITMNSISFMKKIKMSKRMGSGQIQPKDINLRIKLRGLA